MAANSLRIMRIWLPRMLVLDEPTAGLDPKGRDEILELIKELHEQEKMTVVLVSHSMDDVANYVDRLLVMNKGRLMFDDVPHEVFRHEQELEQMGLALPQVTYIMQKLRAGGINVSADATTISEATAELRQYLEKR